MVVIHIGSAFHNIPQNGELAHPMLRQLNWRNGSKVYLGIAKKIKKKKAELPLKNIARTA